MKISQLHFESDKILSSLSLKDRNYLLSHAELLSFKKGKLIFYENGIPTGVFILKKGKVKIYKTGISDRSQIFYIYKEGDMFGYHALLSNENYEDSCETIENCEVLFIQKSDFNFVLQQLDRLKLLLIQNMSHEFGVLVNTITILAHKTLRERLALYLLILHDRYQGSDSNDQVAINLSREDLANIIGTTRESLGRLLKDFREEQLIQVEGRRIFLKKPEMLRKIALLP